MRDILSRLVAGKEARYVGSGRVRGKLYNLGEYPGAVEDDVGFVYGDVYEISNMDEVLPRLDEYEGFNRDKREESLFIRKVIEVFMDDGSTLKASVYIYNGRVREEDLIPDGVWKV
jgi:gamma-glutamylcyclotransferase (GGCT)/AIG2-like uncharacterized protein YtfP